ncbi:regulator [Halalkalibacter wakoensis JCM 9140]|uniref:Regulator n=1 Tax=Halalkalibacter wakoensis JCM 9140 TaxID=1236970 RepID=W4Q9D0_9BACI|nr:helix-turn-helix domain-containing protein [Halalkalibacter wakoensis]GAE28577.1 regulator [Halalkalibacter wakoensis JCM 9140]
MIGTRIKEERLKKGFSLSELALRADVAISYLSSVERNIQSNPSIQFLEKIAEALDTQIHSLMGNKNEELDGDLDEEWLQLAKEAQNSGISKQQFVEYLEFTKWQKQKEQEK